MMLSYFNMMVTIISLQENIFLPSTYIAISIGWFLYYFIYHVIRVAMHEMLIQVLEQDIENMSKTDACLP